MAADLSSARPTGVADAGAEPRATSYSLRTLVIAAGIIWAVLFVVVGLRYQLQLFADGAMFSYSVAVQEAWTFHWHNISGRLFVYLIAEAPAEFYVALTDDPRGGIVLYGLLFFATQLVGLLATWAGDRSPGRIIFSFACASTACLCPLVFGFPSEMWVAHALFWPTLAVCHYARANTVGSVLIFSALLALIFTHGGAVLLGVLILATLLLRGARDPAYVRAARFFLMAVLIWALVKLIFPPDAYDGPMMRRAALHFFDPAIFASHILVLLFAAAGSYAVAFLALDRLHPRKAHTYAGWLLALALSAYWLWFDASLHGTERYPMRTVLLLGTLAFGLVAAAYALVCEGRLKVRPAVLQHGMAFFTRDAATRAILGAFLIVMLVHGVETAKFVRAWTGYEAAVRALAMSDASDRALGDVHFVSASRIDPALNRLSWFSTTQFLSVLVAPRFAPERLVVDPTGNYFWLSCNTAAASQMADRAIPVESRRLIRVHACLHR